MTDLEMTLLCAGADWTAIEYRAQRDELRDDDINLIVARFRIDGTAPTNAQSMALVKRFCLEIADQSHGIYATQAAWSVWYRVSDKHLRGAQNHDLNRAIGECASHAQLAKRGEGKDGA